MLNLENRGKNATECGENYVAPQNVKNPAARAGFEFVVKSPWGEV
jgi:hypothetical protein